MKSLDIKAGSICLYKEYNFFTRMLANLFRKQLPYNCYKIYCNNNTLFVETTNKKVKNNKDYIILEPVKPYSKKEREKLKESCISYAVITNYQSGLVHIINNVRSSTLEETSELSSLLRNKYYKILYDSKGKNI